MTRTCGGLWRFSAATHATGRPTSPGCTVDERCVYDRSARYRARGRSSTSVRRARARGETMGSQTYVGMVDRDRSICPGSIQLWRGPTGDRYRAQSMRHDHLGTYRTREAAEDAIREYHRRHGPSERDVTAALVDRLCAMIPEPDRRAMWREDDDPIAAFFIERRMTLTLEEIGRLYGLTRERIRQVQEVALRKALPAAMALEMESPADRPDLWDTIETYHG